MTDGYRRNCHRGVIFFVCATVVLAMRQRLAIAIGVIQESSRALIGTSRI